MSIPWSCNTREVSPRQSLSFYSNEQYPLYTIIVMNENHILLIVTIMMNH